MAQFSIYSVLITFAVVVYGALTITDDHNKKTEINIGFNFHASTSISTPP